jgi:hypothetical protein
MLSLSACSPPVCVGEFFDRIIDATPDTTAVKPSW